MFSITTVTVVAATAVTAVRAVASLISAFVLVLVFAFDCMYDHKTLVLDQLLSKIKDTQICMKYKEMKKELANYEDFLVKVKIVKREIEEQHKQINWDYTNESIYYFLHYVGEDIDYIERYLHFLLEEQNSDLKKEYSKKLVDYEAAYKDAYKELKI